MENRELDRLIATHIMGWEKEPFQPFFPSSDIRDAWEVVEKFDYFSIEKDDRHYYCTLSNGPFYQGDGDTPQISICLAALKSKGIEPS